MLEQYQTFSLETSSLFTKYVACRLVTARQKILSLVWWIVGWTRPFIELWLMAKNSIESMFYIDGRWFFSITSKLSRRSGKRIVEIIARPPLALVFRKSERVVTVQTSQAILDMLGPRLILLQTQPNFLNAPQTKNGSPSHLTDLPKINKAVYTAASVACFWAGAVTLLTTSKAETALLYQFG